MFVFGLRQGIDLRGGTRWQITFLEAGIREEAVRNIFNEAGAPSDILVKRFDDGSFVIRLPDISEEGHQLYLESLEALGDLREDNFSSIGPAIGSELRRKALWAILLVMLGISFYIAFAFRKVSEPVKSWKYGIVTLVTLFHDVAIPTGLLALLGRWKGVEIDTNFIGACLVVMVFSVHDTIVVFDRIRENLLKNRGRNQNLGDIINWSVKETFARSVNTSLTLIFILLTLLIFGPPTLFYFVLTILVGTVFGTYSSIFIASPLLYMWRGKAGGH